MIVLTVSFITSIDTLDPGSRQIAVQEGRDGLAGLRDPLLVVVLFYFIVGYSKYEKKMNKVLHNFEID